MPSKPLLVVVVGPTASGKTALAISLAQALGTEILSFDSRQFYRELQIGAAIPTVEERAQVKHHFIADRSFTEHLSAGAFERQGNERLQQLFEKQKVVVAVGGSGLFAQALIAGFDDIAVKNEASRAHWRQVWEQDGIGVLQASLLARDPLYATQVDMQNHQRLIRALEVIDSTGQPYSHFRLRKQKTRPYETMWIGIDINRTTLHHCIDERVLAMMEAGLEAEARGLYPYRAAESLITVGYRELFAHFDGEYPLEEAIRLIQRNTRHFARRQLTWFRKNDKIQWFEPQQETEILELIRSFETSDH